MMFRARPTFAVDKAGMQRELTGPQSQMVRFLRETTRETVNVAKTQSLSGIPVDTGLLRNSIRHDHIRIQGMRATTFVSADQNYAAAVHDGTRPHLIRAKNKKALAFKKGGKTVFVKQVNHPGTKPNPFLFRAAKQVGERRGFIVTRQ